MVNSWLKDKYFVQNKVSKNFSGFYSCIYSVHIFCNLFYLQNLAYYLCLFCRRMVWSHTLRSHGWRNERGDTPLRRRLKSRSQSSIRQWDHHHCSMVSHQITTLTGSNHSLTVAQITLTVNHLKITLYTGLNYQNIVSNLLIFLVQVFTYLSPILAK